MRAQHLFDSAGKWIAFRVGDNVFDTFGGWIGWLPWGDQDVVDIHGEYLGTIFGDRLFRLAGHPYRGYPGRAPNPEYPGYPGFPGVAPPAPLPTYAFDIDL